MVKLLKTNTNEGEILMFFVLIFGVRNTPLNEAKMVFGLMLFRVII